MDTPQETVESSQKKQSYIQTKQAFAYSRVECSWRTKTELRLSTYLSLLCDLVGTDGSLEYYAILHEPTAAIVGEEGENCKTDEDRWESSAVQITHSWTGEGGATLEVNKVQPTMESIQSILPPHATKELQGSTQSAITRDGTEAPIMSVKQPSQLVGTADDVKWKFSFSQANDETRAQRMGAEYNNVVSSVNSTSGPSKLVIRLEWSLQWASRKRDMFKQKPPVESFTHSMDIIVTPETFELLREKPNVSCGTRTILDLNAFAELGTATEEYEQDGVRIHTRLTNRVAR